MNIFLAGATGAIGKRLVPLLVPFQHDTSHSLGAQSLARPGLPTNCISAAICWDGTSPRRVSCHRYDPLDTA